MDRPNLIFYSLKNKKCNNFYHYLINNHLNNKFQLINVDTDKSNASKKINQIPTMIIPSINKVYFGDDVYNFFQQIPNKSSQPINQPIQSNQPIKQSQQKPIQSNQPIKQLQQKPNQPIKQQQKPIQSTKQLNQNKEKKEEKDNEVLGYIEYEMNGLSDKYYLINSTISPIHNYGIYN